MINTDQFSNLPSELMIAFSSTDDGTMLDRMIGVHNEAVVKNRQRFCTMNAADYADCVYQRIIYDERASYALLAEVDDRSTTKHVSEIVADGLFTRHKNVGMLLPVGDCIATILYDAASSQLAMLHLGRHSTLTDLLPRTIQHFASGGADPANMQVWMAPSVRRASYRMNFFSQRDDPEWQPFVDVRSDGVYLDMQGFNKQRCVVAGIPEEHITLSPIDTAIDAQYFSHSRGDTTGRIAVLAMMR